MTDYRDFYRELRTDWLKLRGYLFDPNTSLPSLPMVLDGVRRRLESGETVGLIYMDPSGGGHLETTHGWQAYDQLIREVAEALRASHSLSDLDKNTLAVVGVRSDELMIFPRLDPSVDEAGSSLERLRTVLIEEVQRHLRQHQPETLFWAPLQSSSAELKTEPTIRIERSIYLGLQRAREQCRQESERRHSDLIIELERILAEQDIVTRYQPIVDLRSGDIHGVEALSKAPVGSPFESPDMLFSFAEETGRIVELDRLCRLRAVQRSSTLLNSSGAAAKSKLFINCSAQVFHDPSLLSDLHEIFMVGGIEPQAMVLEITERVAITEWQAFRETLEVLRQAGAQVAIDDMGSGYSSLRAVAEIEPDYLKFDLSLVSGIHLSPIKRELLATLVILARKIGALPIAEGIEQQEEFETVKSMGIDFGQGYFLGLPVEAAQLSKTQGGAGAPPWKHCGIRSRS